CTPPNASRARAASASTSAAFATLVGTASVSTPAPATARAPSPGGARSMSASTTFIPAIANRCASARPIPLAAPVTTAALPAKSFIPCVFARHLAPEQGSLSLREKDRVRGCDRFAAVRHRGDKRFFGSPHPDPLP